MKRSGDQKYGEYFDDTKMSELSQHSLQGQFVHVDEPRKLHLIKFILLQRFSLRFFHNIVLFIKRIFCLSQCTSITIAAIGVEPAVKYFCFERHTNQAKVSIQSRILTLSPRLHNSLPQEEKKKVEEKRNGISMLQGSLNQLKLYMNTKH